jgi:AcrR family transcriptional regulator
MSTTNDTSAENAGQGRAPHQLPPGRHGLSRGFVAANQRERMLDAVADVVSFKGYVAMSVEDIVSAAGVSRRTFYDNFKDKQEAFLDAFDAIGGELIRRVGVTYDASARFPDGVIAGLRAFLGFAAEEPRYADMCIVEVLAAGPAAIGRRNAVMKALAELLHTGSQTVPNGIQPPALSAETVVGGVYEVVYSRVLQGQAGELLDLLPDLAYSMMLPYLGHEQAEREVRQLIDERQTRVQ